ncbi:PEP-CTERM motif protein [Planctomycetes bacterium CA13]|uniref:PEP-CTERM motif protein n=1 Tax=Novipirellula herctigrandis TaxID=2527986 RepID=A0A5C5Z721_9BACT|nr:PEP-CTERM motif protein [Planctomycetes bacterium CA13]
MWKRLLSICLITGLLHPVAFGAIYTGNGNSGFGGVIGTGTLELAQVGTTGVINGTVTKGTADFNDELVIYLNTTVGGFNTTSTFDDNGDTLRRAISGLSFDGTNRATLNFSAGFDADYAIALSVNDFDFAGLFSLSETGAHGFVADLGLTPIDPSDASTSFSFDLASLGLAPGNSFEFVGAYLNGDDAFRADEAIGDGIAPGNPGQGTTVAYTGSRTFSTVTAVPEPSSVAFIALGAGAAVLRRRRR